MLYLGDGSRRSTNLNPGATIVDTVAHLPILTNPLTTGSDGSVYVAWEDPVNDGGTQVVRISPQGTNDTKPLRASSLPGVVFLTPRFTTRSVGIDSQGNFVVIWQDETYQGKMTVFVNAEACADGAAVAVLFRRQLHSVAAC